MEGKGGGEVRRLNIVYFLSRNGHIEHPHLIRIHHFSHNGVRLRDVKRWLSELRGKDIAESFTWSYKRKYKQTRFVWQDLLDGDLITPISDNEYIIKGTQISSTPIYDDVSSCDEKGVLKHNKLPLLQTKKKDHKISSKQAVDQQNSLTPVTVSSTKKNSEIEEESPPFSTYPFIITYNSIKLEKGTRLTAAGKKDDENENFENSCFFNSNFLYNSNNKKNGINFNTSTPGSSTSSTPSSSLRSRSNSRGSSKSYKSTSTSKPKGLGSLVGLFIPPQIVTLNNS